MAGVVPLGSCWASGAAAAAAARGGGGGTESRPCTDDSHINKSEQLSPQRAMPLLPYIISSPLKGLLGLESVESVKCGGGKCEVREVR
jgi:hypothetical protein